MRYLSLFEVVLVCNGICPFWRQRHSEEGSDYSIGYLEVDNYLVDLIFDLQRRLAVTLEVHNE